MESFWEADALYDWDVAIIGGGILGLSTAIEIRERDPRASVVVLERELLPTGASTRNAGFLCAGTLTEILADHQSFSLDTIRTNIQHRLAGIRMVRERLGDAAIGYEAFGGYELLREHEMGALEAMPAINNQLEDLFGGPPFIRADDRIAAFGFDARVCAMVYCPFDAQMHSGKLMRALAQLAGERGVTILTGATVTDLTEDGDGVHLKLRSPDAALRVPLMKAQQVVACTNAWTADLLPHAFELIPARGQILLTDPIEDLRFKGIFHFDQGYYYFRNLGNRILLGGARNTDFATEATTSFEINNGIHRVLESQLTELILPYQVPHIARRWCGIMAFHESRTPLIERVSQRIMAGFACNGTGMAMASVVARSLALEVMTADGKPGQ